MKINNIFVFILLFLTCCNTKNDIKTPDLSGIAGTEAVQDSENSQNFRIINKTQTLDLLREYAYQVMHDNSCPIIWTSNNPDIISIDDNGKMTAKKTGKALIQANADADKSDSVEVEVTVNPMYLFEKFHVERTFGKEVTTNGITVKEQYVSGSVSLYWTGNLNLENRIIAVNQNRYTGLKANYDILKAADLLKKIRSGILLEEIKYITYHDTGNNSALADAELHAYYITSDENLNHRSRSWHYTVDDKKVIAHIPDNETAWQGDSYDAYGKSIGIETCIAFGSDLYSVWQRTAKLIAMLLNKYDLEPDAVKQHNHWSGKNCPEVLRHNGIYDIAMDMVMAEYMTAKYLDGYNISFESFNTEYVDHCGKVIKTPKEDLMVSYMVKIKNNSGYNESKMFSSVIKGISAE